MSTDLERRDPVRDLVVQVRSDQFVHQLALALPETVSPRRFARIAVTAIQQNPDLANCSQPSIMQALLRCAADGLLPDGREAALVKYGDKAAYLPMIGGYRKIAADHGWVLRTRAVYANDDFDYSEEPPELTHRPARPGQDRGDLVAAYAIAEHKDGRRLLRVMDEAEIGKRREVARSKNVWQQWPAAMFEKTVGRDLFQELPLGDLDQARVRSVVAADQAFEQAAHDPAAALYGPTVGEGSSAAPAADAAPSDPTPGASVAGDGDEAADDTGRGEQAAQTPAAAAAPDNEAEEAVWAPVPTSEEIAAAARMVVPRGVHKGKTIAEVADTDQGPAWLLRQLKAVPADAPARESLETFTQALLPEVWGQYEAWLAEQPGASG